MLLQQTGATSCGRTFCAGPEQAGEAGAELQGRMKLMTICSMSKGALARLTGALLQQKSWLLPLEMCSKCSCCPAAEMGKGQGRTLTPMHVASPSHLPSLYVPPVPASCGTCRKPGWVQQAGETGRGKQQCPTSSRSILISAFLNHRHGFVCGISAMRFRN